VATIIVTPHYTFGAVTCDGATRSFTITVQPTPVVAAITGQELCNGSSTTAVNFAGTSTSYSWTNDTPSIGLPASGTGNIAAFTAVNNSAAPVTATITVTSNYGVCIGTTQAFTIRVNPNPTFNAANNAVNICSGGSTNIAFTSPTAGHRINVTNVNYGSVTGGTVVQNVTTFTDGAGLTETLTNTTSAPIDVVYTFSVTTPLTTPVCPLTPVIQVVTVRVQPTPAFNIVNGAAQICSGSQANITLQTPVTGGQVRLQAVTYGAASGTLSSGVLYNDGQQVSEVLINNTNAPVTVTYVFEAIVGSCGPGATQSTQVIVNPNPSFTATNNAPTICSGTATNILFNSLTTAHKINVVSATYGSVSGGSLTPASLPFVSGNTITETLVNNTTAPIDVVYVFNVTTPTTPSCPLSPVNQTVIVRVLPDPAFTLTNAAAQICSGSQADITLNTAVSGAQVRLQSVNYGTVTGTLSPGVIFNNGQKVTEVLINNSNAPVTVVYSFEAVVGACTPSAIQTTSVVVNPNPTFTATNNSANICSGTATNITFASPTIGHRINVVSVTYGSVSGGTVVQGVTIFNNGGSLVESLTNATMNPIDVVYVFNVTTPSTSPVCPLVPANQTVIVRVQPASSFTVTNNAARFCSGNQTDILLGTPVIGVQIRLASVNYGTVTGTLTAGALYTDGQRIKEVLTNTTNAPVTVIYTFEAVVSGCAPSAQQTASIIVDPIPTIATNLSLQDLCSGQIPTITLSNPNNVGGTQYTWTVAATNVTGASNQPTPVAAGAINTALSLTVGATTGTVNYNVRAVAMGCFSSPESVLLTLRQQPTVSVPPNVPQCEPSSIALEGTIGGSATSALWSVITGGGTLSSTNIVAGAPIKANASYTVAPADVASAVTMRLSTNDPDGPSGLCQAVTADYTIPISRSAKVTAGPDLLQCEDAPSIQLQGATAYAPNGTQWSLVSAAGTFTNAASPTSDYSFVDPAESGQTVTLRITAFDPDGPSPAGPCADVSDIMTLKINKLPVVSYVGFPTPASMAENEAPRILTGNKEGGLFTISPITSVIGATVRNPTDQVSFDPSIVELGPNTVTYTFTDPATGCSNFNSQLVIINPVTNVDFIIERGNFTSIQEWELCADQGKVKLIGNPVVADGFPPETRFHLSPDFPNGGLLYNNQMDIVFENNDWYIDTNGAVSDTYMVRYTFKNQFNAVTYKEYPVHIFASPVSVINVDNSCVKDVIQFNDASTLPSNPFGGAINEWRWDFDDQSFSNFQNPSHGYIQPRYYDIGLMATTNQGCTGTTTKQIRVGDQPTVVFDWSALCNNEYTRFKDASSAGISNITSYTWDFGDGTAVTGAPNVAITGSSQTIGTFNNPQHNYSVDGRYTARLTINTDDGCVNQLAQQVNIFPAITVHASTTEAYQQDFEAPQNGWSPESLWKERGLNQNDSARYSWMRGLPDGANINSAAGGSNVWWTGRRVTVDPFGNSNPRYTNPDSYFKSESSAVNGPCFDLTQLQRPMISLDYWSDVELNRDGAVLQYSTDGGFTWELIGPFPGKPDRDEGINWYRSQGIVGKPGNQRTAGDYGWSGRTGKWENARFNLDMVDAAKRDQVRLRIAFGSEDDNDNSSGIPFDGFAFDNIFVGDKTRNVLVEHFTSTDGGSLIADGEINHRFDTQVNDRINYGGQPDFYNIQYHIKSTTADPLNKDNEIDPATRAVFMSVSGPPTTILDGLRTPPFNGSYVNVNLVEIDRRALKDPQFVMKLDTVTLDPTTTPLVANKIHPIITLTAQQDFNTPLLLNVALIEDVDGHRNVLRKLLFGPDGLTISNAIARGEIIVRDKGTIDINAPVRNPDGLTMIAFIQDKLTKEIYQAAVLKAPHKVGGTIIGVEEEVSQESVITKSIDIYPNPANNRYFFRLPDGVSKNGDNYKWKLADQRGVVVRNGDFSGSIGGTVEVDISPFASGMYIIVIEGPNNSVAYHKLMIINRH
jgi:PKD repeat protein